MAATAPDRTGAHRAGPVEFDDDDRLVQRCLRCDALLRIVANPGKRKRDPIPVGDYVVSERACRGTWHTPDVLQYDDD